MNQRIPMIARAIVAMLPLAMVLAAAVEADDIHVDNVNGDDARNGLVNLVGSANSGAVRTIGRALELARSGDQIIIANTGIPYQECITLQSPRHGGSSLFPFRVISDGAILDGTGPVRLDAWEHVAGDVYRFQPQLKSYQMMYLEGRPLKRADDPATLEPMQWALSKGWIYFRTEAGRLPASWDLSCCRHQTGITLYECSHVQITGLIVQGFQLDGINAHGGVDHVSISECTLRGNGRSGLSCGGASSVVLRDSISGNNFEAQIRTEGLGVVNVESCRLLQADGYGQATVSDGGHIRIDGREVE
jgi:hypothetical protein